MTVWTTWRSGSRSTPSRFRIPERVCLITIGLALIVGIALLVVHSISPAPAAREAGRAIEAAPSLVIKPVPATQGGTIHITGRGFAPNETVVIWTSDRPASSAANDAGRASAPRQILARTRTNQRGDFALSAIGLPENLSSGIHPLEADGLSSSRRAAAGLPIRARNLWINVSSYAVTPPTRFGFIVGGFAPREQVQISLEPAARLPTGQSQDVSRLSPSARLTSIPTDEAGNTVWTEITLPLLKPGAYTLIARGVTSQKQITADLHIQPRIPVVELSPWSGPPGTAVELNGRGFAPREEVQLFLGNDQTPRATFRADQWGNLWAAGPIQVPYHQNEGPLPLRLIGLASAAEVTTTFTVLSLRPWLNLNQYWGPPGSSVAFSGGGWAAGERVTIHLESASGRLIGIGQADSAGWLAPGASGSVPGDAPTAVTFVAVGEQSQATASATFRVASLFVPAG